MTSSPAPASDSVWTVGRIIDWTTGHLRKHGSETPRLDAEILLAHTRRCPRIQLYVDYAVPLLEAERTMMRDLVRRRANAEPVAYLVGHREFYGLDFRVTRDVLIPRPETETLVLELITAARRLDTQHAQESTDDAGGSDSSGRRPREAKCRILDVGTDSGRIAVACAVNLPGAELVATDISPEALAIARENADRHGVTRRIGFRQGDLFAAVGGDEQFDFVATNPPYVAEAEMAELPADIRLHEPPLALRAGPKGLDVIERLVAGAASHLVPRGRLLLEISPEQAESVAALIAAAAAFEPARILKDASGRLRVVIARRLP